MFSLFNARPHLRNCGGRQSAAALFVIRELPNSELRKAGLQNQNSLANMNFNQSSA